MQTVHQRSHPPLCGDIRRAAAVLAETSRATLSRRGILWLWIFASIFTSSAAGADIPEGKLQWLRKAITMNPSPGAAPQHPGSAPFSAATRTPEGNLRVLTGGALVLHDDTANQAFIGTGDLTTIDVGRDGSVSRSRPINMRPVDFRVLRGELCMGPRRRMVMTTRTGSGSAFPYIQTAPIQSLDDAGIVLWKQPDLTDFYYFRSPAMDSKSNCFVITTLLSHETEQYVSRLSALGAFSQVLRFPSNGFDFSARFTLNPTGGMYVGATVMGVQRFAGLPVGARGTNSVAFGKLDGQGDPQWMKSVGPSLASEILGFNAHTNSGLTLAVWIAAQTNSVVSFGDHPVIAAKDRLVLVGQFSDSGSFRWVRQISGPELGENVVKTVEGDDSGNVFLFGSSLCGTQISFDGALFPSLPLSANICDSFSFLACYGREGDLKWANYFPSPKVKSVHPIPDGAGGCFLILETVDDFTLNGLPAVFQDGINYAPVWVARFTPP